jgi:S-DNA-T family DNA segregation ATPase FtsK/SpoIIIE
LQVTVERLRAAGGPPAHQVWLPPLDVPATLDELLPGLAVVPGRGLSVPVEGLWVPVGLVDRPFEQRRDLLVADLDGGKGHVAIVGGPQMGKTTLARALIAALALTKTPLEAQFFCLDFGGGGLAALGGLPHVASVASRLDKERVTRTVREVGNLLERREVAFARDGIDSMAAYRRAKQAGRFAADPYGDVFLVIDGWGVFRNDYDSLEGVIQQVASTGLTYGVHLVITSARWSEVRAWLRDMVQTRFELRLGDAIESEMDMRAAKKVPEAPGRGITADLHHWLGALPRVDGRPDPKDVGAGLAHLVSAVAAAWDGPRVPQVRLLPTQLPAVQLPPPEGDLRVPLGLEGDRLEPLWHDFAETPHLIAFGDTETGKTNLLRLIAGAITAQFSPTEARILCADPQRGLHDAVPAEYRLSYELSAHSLATTIAQAAPVMHKRLPGPEVGPDRLPARDWWTGPRLFVLIDDYDLFSSSPADCPTRGLVDLLAPGAQIGLHVIVARTTSNGMRAMLDPMIRRMWDIGTPGLLFSCRREEGSFLGDAKPMTLIPGRAQFVHRRHGVRMLHTALAAPPGGDGGAGEGAR